MSNTSKQFNFDQAVIWVTGASSGIGAAFAIEAARRGARLALSSRGVEQLETVRKDCIAAGAGPEDVLVLPLDLEDETAMPAAVDRVRDHFGRIDLLLNNAGMSQRSLCLDTDMSVYHKIIKVDLLGQIALTKQVLPLMVEQGSGTLAVTSSVAGKVGSPMRTAYCAAKHGVMGFFDALRVETAHLGLNVTTIVPGSIRTPVAHNALTGSGKPTGVADPAIEAGMPVDDCARVIADGFAGGIEEINVGTGPEMQLLEMKRQDPTATFRLLESWTAELFKGNTPHLNQ
ncbi:SDR family NAD(P)-dependent oxidoreductase [Parahaliea aestuarii]|uniref:SDR family NAD(P)-dependent oxidoreductase n=1 Tax=Parahaliea aestuarii TaxID=1852021 RepID=A0A5C9A3R1_9GAMM|nr:SDR family NAD(P)-dependent oxidoreductase [Parahaliea aestuarii]TXS94709.1 SDR family NAD(P)-dependent oxidoreductase [Parahaliea aestuarii]